VVSHLPLIWRAYQLTLYKIGALKNWANEHNTNAELKMF